MHCEYMPTFFALMSDDNVLEYKLWITKGSKVHEDAGPTITICMQHFKLFLQPGHQNNWENQNPNILK